MNTYKVCSCGHDIFIEADFVVRVGGVLELSRNENNSSRPIAWFSSWDSCLELKPEENVDERKS